MLLLKGCRLPETCAVNETNAAFVLNAVRSGLYVPKQNIRGYGLDAGKRLPCHLPSPVSTESHTLHVVSLPHRFSPVGSALHLRLGRDRRRILGCH